MSDLYTLFDLLGTIAFAISGATTAVRKDMDLLGVIVLGVVTAVGGGTLRDVISNNTPAILYSPENVWLAVITSVATFIIMYVNLDVESDDLYNLVFIISDSLGLAIFTVAGMQKVFGMYTLGVVVFFGVLTAVGGGIIRDILCGETPYVLTKHFYASSCIVGGITYAALRPGNRELAAVIAMIIVFACRILAIKFNWNLPKVKRN